jgi:hypothetical protein
MPVAHVLDDESLPRRGAAEVESGGKENQDVFAGASWLAAGKCCGDDRQEDAVFHGSGVRRKVKTSWRAAASANPWLAALGVTVNLS